MDFNRSALRHRLSVAPFEPGLNDVFVRADDGTVEHYWSAGLGEGVMFGPERLGGHFDTDPVAVREFDGTSSRLHLIGRSGITIVDWRWEDTGPGLLGAPVVVSLPGFCVTEPEVLRSGGQLHVFAVAHNRTLRHWSHGPQGWTSLGSIGTEVAASKPVAVSRAPGVIDVFALSADNHRLAHWSNPDGVWHFETRAGSDLVGRPTVASYERDRLDVFAVRSDGVPAHWGWNGSRWFDNELRLKMTFGLSSVVVATRDIHLIEFGVDRLTLFARTKDNQLAEWTLQPPNRWSGPNVIGGAPRPFACWSTQDDRLDVLIRNDGGGFTHHFFINNPGAGMGEPVAGSWESETLELTEPEPSTIVPLPVPVEPDVLLVRPRDLVVLGVRWSGFEVRQVPGASAELVAGPAAELTVIFPPQHVVEEVVPAGGPDTPGINPAMTAGFPTWRSALSGASRVVVGVAESERIPLTAQGVLDALRRGSLLPSQGVLDAKTALELPFGLVFSPFSPDMADIRCTHPTALVPSTSGSLGLWQTTVSLNGVPSGAPAGLAFRAIAARSTDPFAVPLTRGSRGRIMIEPPTATIDRLLLSALGGSLTASGLWETFEWEHVAVLGRDRRVRTATKGVLYPFGHRAEYVEVTERVFESTADGAIAKLRKSTSLRITEPVRHETAPNAAFPFSEVEFERTFFEGLEDAWETVNFPVPERQALESAREQWEHKASELFRQLAAFDEMDPDFGEIEDLAAGLEDGADAPLDPDDPESPTRAEGARSLLWIDSTIAHIDEQIAALEDLAVAPVNVFFVPRLRRDQSALPPADAAPLRFPLRLAGRLGDLHVSVAVVFVADITLEPGLFTPAFSSLADREILTRVEEAYRAVDDGVIEVGGTRIDLVRSRQPVDGDVCEVQRLHVLGEVDEGSFRPRLGAVPARSEGRVPASDRWGFEAVLPSVRTLLGKDQPLRLALSRGLLEGNPVAGIVFEIPAGVEKLATEFSKNSARSGGIAAPDIVADGISRTDGPVRVAGLLDRAGETLNPKNVLSDTASLLGYRLSDLIDATKLTKPPAMLQGIADGAPVVTLQWKDIALATSSGSFVTGPDSKMTLDVTIGATGQIITCTVDDVVLALPDRDEVKKLIEVTLGQVVFTQRDGAAPTLEVKDIDAKFFGLLNLLKELQEAVDLGGAAPHIEASSSGISAAYALPVPDVTSGVFQMTGLVFHAGIEVPFDNRPVSISLAFASRAKPFNLSVLLLGGGGYVDVVIDKGGLRKLELALEFGASISVNFVVAFGEVHAMGGIRLLKLGDDFELTGYLRFGGSLSILGLVTASVELAITLRYNFSSNEMIGRAKLVLEIDVTLVSASVELDTGDWVFVGGQVPPGRIGPLTPASDLLRENAFNEWRRYRSAFAGAVR